MDGGIGESMLIGAAVGGGTSLLTGQDPLRGALLGGITGGVGGAMFGGASGAAGSQAGSTAAATDVAKSISPLNSMAEAPAALGAELSSTAVQPVNTIAETATAAAPGSTSFWQGANSAAVPPAAIQNTPIIDQGIIRDTSFMPVKNIGAGSTATPYYGGNETIPTQAVAPAAQKGFFGNMMDKYNNLGTMGKIGVGIGGGLALNALTNPQTGLPVGSDEEENPFGLATYDRSKYKPNNLNHGVYKPVYSMAAEGGVMKSYAQGGIAALAGGGMGNNQMYPQGLQDHTQFATPSQMPTSAQVVNADYEQKTDPYSGSPLGMAEGGVARTPANGYYAKGGAAYGYNGMGGWQDANGGLNPMGMLLRQAATPKVTIPDSVAAYRAYIDQQAAPNVYDSQYQHYIQGTPMVTSPEYAEEGPSFMDSYNLLQAAAPNIANTISEEALSSATTPSAPSGEGKAGGGIVGYSLGGYAAGGNPRLLKGPGDGMSDNIPATIGDKQPARLADGEFVVPADVVSHLGNGSTDAGAKHLYNMMDKVRKARTGNKKQGKQIKPEKFLPA